VPSEVCGVTRGTTGDVLDDFPDGSKNTFQDFQSVDQKKGASPTLTMPKSIAAWSTNHDTN